MSEQDIKNCNNKGINWEHPESEVDMFKGLSKEKVEILQSIIWEQFNKGITIKPQYCYYNEESRELIKL